MNEELVGLIIISEPKKVEFRLYYDNLGNPVTYTADNSTHPYQYIVVDAHTYALGRFDIKVIDEKIATNVFKKYVAKLVPSMTEGTNCSVGDISILVNEDKECTKWKLSINEY